MLTKWKIALPLLLGSAVAQQFTDWVYDYDVDYYTSTCKTAINKTLECNAVPDSIVFQNNEPTDSHLEKLCTKKCEASLIQTQKDIVKACPVAQNNVTLQHGGLVTAQDNIRELLDGFTKACLKDPNTGKFCLPIMGSWPLIKDHTREQNCSDCALGAMQLGLNSELTYNEKVASEFSVLTKSCQKTGFDVQVPTKAVTSPASGTKPSTTMTTIPCETPYTIHAEDTCNGICKSQNVSTYAFTQTNRLNIWCDNLPKAGTVVCLPKTCDVYTVEKDDTCGRIAYKFSRYAPGFSMTQLISWNPTINDVCSNIGHHVGMQICVSPPSLGHLKPSATSSTVAPITPAPEPSNLANGTNTQCAQYYNITKGDTCADVTLAAGISLKDFYFLNPSVDKKCTNLILGESYCVRAMGDIETYPGYTSTFSKKPGEGIDTDGGPDATLGPGWRTELPTPVNTEKPLASGTWDTDKCRVYYKWAELSNDELTQEWNSCEEIARRYRTTVETLKKWNPSLAEASPCIINKKDRYCVYLRDEYRSSTTTTTAVDSKPTLATPSATSSSTTKASTTKPSEGIPTPSNVAPDTIAGCKNFYTVVSGDYCYSICEDNKITQEDFIKWNLSVKKDCSLVQKGLSYCIGR
ncbi:unnamed protein product [Fusarium langsethiae]|nr:unnamed protein product [Fusarium langsethiae]GKU22335.1 unnamed protein product [Fusarium langsethiae]